jgi:hypothetical protein
MTSYKFQWAISIASNNKRRPPLLIPEYYNLYNIIGQEQAQHRNPAFLRKLWPERNVSFGPTLRLGIMEVLGLWSFFMSVSSFSTDQIWQGSPEFQDISFVFAKFLNTTIYNTVKPIRSWGRSNIDRPLLGFLAVAP